MDDRKELFGIFKDETGEEFYCPVDATNERKARSDNGFDDCVEASTAGRYSGNLEVVGRRFERKGEKP